MSQKLSAIKLSGLQISVLKLFWRHGKLTVNEAHQLLNQEKPMALTTVATMLKRLHEKGAVKFEKQGRQHVYFASVSESQVKTTMLANMLSTLFDGKPDELVHHLVAQEDVQASDIEKIRNMIAKSEQEKRGDNNDD